MQLFSIDSPIARFLYLVADIVTLHILWLLYSLPLITIGASTTALYYSCMKRIRTDEGTIVRNFHQSFRQNFRQSTLLWLFLLAAGGLFVLDFRIGMAADSGLGTFMLIGCSIFLIPYLLLLMYIFPVQAKFENRLLDNVKLSLILALRHFPYSLLLIGIWGTILLLGIFFPPFIGLLLCCGAGFSAYLTSNIFIPIFRKYIPGEFEEDLERSGMNQLRP